MPYTVSYLQACEVEEILAPNDDGVRVEIMEERDDMGFPRVYVVAPTRETLLEFIREHWGDDDDEWFNDYVVSRVEES